MDASRKILSDIITYSKYARYLESEERRETWAEAVNRTRDMHIKKYPTLKNEIMESFKYVHDKSVLGSMRSLNFGGKAIEKNPSRGYNCAVVAMDDIAAFSELMFLLLGGSGVGISVQKHHVRQLPKISGPKKRKRRHLVGDNIEGWAYAIDSLVKAYFENRSTPDFDYSDIRSKGSPVKTSGGKAPGPDPLKYCIYNITRVLEGAKENRGVGCRIKPIEVHDICCHISDAVLSGGIRRSSIISLFSIDDEDMLSSKYGSNLEMNQHRERANNSVVIDTKKIRESRFRELMDRIKNSPTGEPGIFVTNDVEMLTNPCGEISLESCSFCNLASINAIDITTQEELNKRAKIASFIGTIQAGYTNFHFLRDKWRENTEKSALLGISISAAANENLRKLDLKQAARAAVEENKRVAELININPAKRITCEKPDGTASLILGTSSGIHTWHANYYIRRMRIYKQEP
ncbi:hypothetical protein GF366_04450, partial [Candidatus Peregrinibacteria bacterium]|nr:hypothetical protein [Candidatus Peregrinibacteria bacterium]